MEAREQKKRKKQRVNNSGIKWVKWLRLYIYFFFLVSYSQQARYTCVYVWSCPFFFTYATTGFSFSLSPSRTHTFFFAYPVFLASLSLPPRSCFASEKRGYRVPSRNCYKQVPQVKKGWKGGEEAEPTLYPSFLLRSDLPTTSVSQSVKCSFVHSIVTVTSRNSNGLPKSSDL